MLEEVWKDVKGFEDKYQISTLGRVKSLSRSVPTKNGNYRRVGERILKLKSDKDGYLSVHLSDKTDNKKGCKHFRIHRLVALAFIENPENKDSVNHKDGIKTNNNLSNLEWMTNLENVHHAMEIGLRSKEKTSQGESHYRAKLSFGIARDIRQLRSEGWTLKRLADFYDVCQDCIHKVTTNQRWVEKAVI